MPDWSYLTVGQPLLFRLPAAVARECVLQMLGTTVSLPFGAKLVDLLGHMRADTRSHSANECQSALSSVSPTCMSNCIDPDLKAVRAFERFGFGCMLVGPFESESVAAISRDDDVLSVHVPIAESSISLEVAKKRLAARNIRGVHVVLQCQDCDDAEHVRRQIDSLSPEVDAVVVTATVASQLGEAPEFLLIHHSVVGELPGMPANCIGYFIDGSSVADGVRTIGPDCLDSTCAILRSTRQVCGAEPFLLAAGGACEPEQAVMLLDAGANVVALDAGLVFGGPGLAKRINETVEAISDDHRNVETPPNRQLAADPAAEEIPWNRSSWTWTMAMGLAMLLGGLLATAIALTRVTLPYDEALVGMSRVELAAINDRLLDFMKHDRITLAGTMLSVGGLYAFLSWFAIRRGSHWAIVTVCVSAFAGFASFFGFLGFGYFDPFHAFVTAVLFQFLLLAVFSHEPKQKRPTYVDLKNDRPWRIALWGQLLFILHGSALIVAGFVISFIGITSVFVQEDMVFLCTTREKLLEANSQLISLVAHDRATFGGMLISCGIVVLLTSLWGFRRGAAWVWWMLLSCGLIAYVMTIWVHHHVGYVDMKHLLPAYAGAASIIVGSWLTRGYLTQAKSSAIRPDFRAD